MGRNEPPRDEVTTVSNTKAGFTVTIEETICKGCGLCISACPRRAIGFASHMNERGFHPAHLTEPDGCTGCGQCAIMCPDACVLITRTRD